MSNNQLTGFITHLNNRLLFQVEGDYYELHGTVTSYRVLLQVKDDCYKLKVTVTSYMLLLQV